MLSAVVPVLLLSASLSGASKIQTASAVPATFSFSTGNPDGKMAMLSRPAGIGLETEAADDFNVTSLTTINHATFTGLIPSGTPLSHITQVRVEIYRVFPLDSLNPPSGNVPTRTNSPSDVALKELDSNTHDLSFIASLVSSTFTTANSVVNGINKSPNQFTGGEGPVTGQEVLIDVVFNKALVLPAGHYFIVPQIQLTNGNFLWLSAPKPIVSPGTPFSPDLQTWIRNSNLAPDWLRVGTDIVGVNSSSTFNAAFTLSGFVGTIAYTVSTNPSPSGDQTPGASVVHPSDLVQVNGFNGLSGNFTITSATLAGPQGTFVGVASPPFQIQSTFPAPFTITTGVNITKPGTYCWSVSVNDTSGSYSPQTVNTTGNECFRVIALTSTPIPAPASCTYAGHPTLSLSQTMVNVSGFVMGKHAEKEIYDCIISGFPTQHYILDMTIYNTVNVGFFDGPIIRPPQQGPQSSFINTQVVHCAKNPSTGALYSCETSPVGTTLLPTNNCKQLVLGSPQKMDTVVDDNGVIWTLESQKEIFSCSTSSGPVIQEVIIWTVNFERAAGAIGSSYAVETCQKPGTSSFGLPLLNCQVRLPTALTT